MRGSIKLGRWLPFRARQLLAPHEGTVWAARVGVVMIGNHHYAAGSGGMAWRLLGLVPVVRAGGPDVTRASAERAAGEAIWVPTALLPRFGARWASSVKDTVIVSVSVDGYLVELRHQLDADGRIRSTGFQRWGDPDNTGRWGMHPFGVQVTGYATFAGTTIPSAGRIGWHFGTDRWRAGEFFRYQITRYQLVMQRESAPATGLPPPPTVD